MTNTLLINWIDVEYNSQCAVVINEKTKNGKCAKPQNNRLTTQARQPIYSLNYL